MTRTLETMAMPDIGLEETIQPPYNQDISSRDFAGHQIPPSDIGEQGTSSLFDDIKHNRATRLMTIGVATLALSSAVKGSINTEKAEAQQPSTEITSLNNKFEFRIAGSKASEETISKATVLGNYRTVSTQRLKSAEKQNRCRVIDGKKVNIWTQGRQESGRPYGRDTRRSVFCKIKTSKGWQWYRKACGNAARLKMPKHAIRGKVFWVNDYRKAHLSVVARSEATARAECRTAGTSAFGYGRGEGYAKATMNLKSGLKKLRSRISSLKSNGSLKASGEARSKAIALASAYCSESSTISPAPAPSPSPSPTPQPSPGPSPSPQPTPERNSPPQGEMVVPQHMYVNGIGKICVKNLYDPDGDQVTARNFRLRDNNGNAIGQVTSDVYAESATTRCVQVKAPSSPGSVVASAELLDGVTIVNSKRTSDNSTDVIVQDTFPVLADQF